MSDEWSREERRKGGGPVAEVRLTDETIAYLQELIAVAVAQAVKSGIEGAINEETAAKFWGAGLTVVQKQAAEHTGRFVLGGLKGLAIRASWFVLLGGMVYAVGGWAGLAKLWTAIWHSGG